MKDINLQIQESHKDKFKGNTSKYIIVKWLKNNDKRKNIESNPRKSMYYLQGTISGMTLDFIRNDGSQKRRKHLQILSVERNCQTKILN